MSQEKLGQHLGLTFQQVQKYERGVNRIGAGRLFALARILGVGILYFYEGITTEASGRKSGFAEAEAPAPRPPPLGADETRLLVAFRRIRDPKLRRRILELVKGMAADVGKRSR